MKFIKILCVFSLMIAPFFVEARCRSQRTYSAVDFGSDWIATAKPGDVVYEEVISDGSGTSGIMCDYQSSSFQTKVDGQITYKFTIIPQSSFNGLTATFEVEPLKLISFTTNNKVADAIWAAFKGQVFTTPKTVLKYPFPTTEHQVLFDAKVKMVIRRNSDPVRPLSSFPTMQPFVGAELNERMEYTRLGGQIGIYESSGSYNFSLHPNVFVPENCTIQMEVDGKNQNISFGTLNEEDFDNAANSKLKKQFSFTIRQKTCKKWAKVDISYQSPQQTAQAGVMRTSAANNNIEAYVLDITDAYDGDYDYAYPLKWGEKIYVMEFEGEGEESQRNYEIQLRKTDSSLPVRSGAFGGMINYTVSIR